MNLFKSLLDLKVDVLYLFIGTELQVFFCVSVLIIAAFFDLPLEFFYDVLFVKKKFVQFFYLCLTCTLIRSSNFSTYLSF